MAKHELTDNAAMQQYEFDIDGQLAVIEYMKPREGVIYLTHTYVPDSLSGQGIGTELVEAVLEDVKRKELAVVPQCEFVAQYIVRHPQWEEIVLKEVMS